nr:hypothetical protein [Wolbachia endosymbiont of Litomosoides sigmodontis]
MDLSTTFAAVGKITLLVDFDSQRNANINLKISYCSRKEKNTYKNITK